MSEEKERDLLVETIGDLRDDIADLEDGLRELNKKIDRFVNTIFPEELDRLSRSIITDSRRRVTPRQHIRDAIRDARRS